MLYVFKPERADQLFGGYTNIAWRNHNTNSLALGKAGRPGKSFIFKVMSDCSVETFKNKENFNEIYHHPDYLVGFSGCIVIYKNADKDASNVA